MLLLPPPQQSSHTLKTLSACSTVFYVSRIVRASHNPQLYIHDYYLVCKCTAVVCETDAHSTQTHKHTNAHTQWKRKIRQSCKQKRKCNRIFCPSAALSENTPNTHLCCLGLSGPSTRLTQFSKIMIIVGEFRN